MFDKTTLAYMMRATGISAPFDNVVPDKGREPDLSVSEITKIRNNIITKKRSSNEILKVCQYNGITKSKTRPCNGITKIQTCNEITRIQHNEITVKRPLTVKRITKTLPSPEIWYRKPRNKISEILPCDEVSEIPVSPFNQISKITPCNRIFWSEKQDNGITKILGDGITKILQSNGIVKKRPCNDTSEIPSENQIIETQHRNEITIFKVRGNGITKVPSSNGTAKIQPFNGIAKKRPCNDTSEIPSENRISEIQQWNVNSMSKVRGDGITKIQSSNEIKVCSYNRIPKSKKQPSNGSTKLQSSNEITRIRKNGITKKISCNEIIKIGNNGKTKKGPSNGITKSRNNGITKKRPSKGITKIQSSNEITRIPNNGIAKERPSNGTTIICNNGKTKERPSNGTTKIQQSKRITKTLPFTEIYKIKPGNKISEILPCDEVSEKQKITPCNRFFWDTQHRSKVRGDGITIIQSSNKILKVHPYNRITKSKTRTCNGITYIQSCNEMSELLQSNQNKFKKAHDNTLSEQMVDNMSVKMKSVGAIVSGNSVRGTVLRVGSKYVITALHVVISITNPRKLTSITDNDWSKLDDPTVYITFAASVMDLRSPIFHIKPDVIYMNTQLDIAVLELKSLEGLPRRLKLSRDMGQMKCLSIIGFGHPTDLRKQLDANCEVLNINHIITDIDNYFNANPSILQLNGLQPGGIKGEYNELGNTHMFPCHTFFEHGSSGAPAVVENEVVGILVKGIPASYYNLRGHSYYTASGIDKLPNNLKFELCVKTESIFNDMCSIVPMLAADLFD